MAADDVTDMLGAIATSAAVNRTVEVAGPKAFPIDELVGKVLETQGDSRNVAADADARYFGAKLDELTLIPAANARLGVTSFEDWLDQSFARAKGTA